MAPVEHVQLFKCCFALQVLCVPLGGGDPSLWACSPWGVGILSHAGGCKSRGVGDLVAFVCFVVEVHQGQLLAIRGGRQCMIDLCVPGFCILNSECIKGPHRNGAFFEPHKMHLSVYHVGCCMLMRVTRSLRACRALCRLGGKKTIFEECAIPVNKDLHTPQQNSVMVSLCIFCPGVMHFLVCAFLLMFFSLGDSCWEDGGHRFMHVPLRGFRGHCLQSKSGGR